MYWGFALLLMILFVRPVLQNPVQPPENRPAEQLQAVVKEYQGLLDAFATAYRQVKGGKEKQVDFYRKHYPAPEQYYSRLLAAVKLDPQDPAAVDALIWVATHQSNEPKDAESQSKALALLGRDYLSSDKL